jgi:hypothetical protein
MRAAPRLYMQVQRSRLALVTEFTAVDVDAAPTRSPPKDFISMVGV